ncbi:hypothetical protein PR202_gb00357 [Eleusine coracana subsp. coracana]|uniref:Reverse transcriptase zinc-binding domain-containing protein n=1 Tax=Eleusine coracana subsp. coracana TaxID=191504 RepID=A0AAV5DU32_ELECO|nr:hypothetical protein PR202_gb00357 [Eleusine coracana subsp. coracana]
MEKLAPEVFAVILPRIRQTRTVAEALHGEVWIQDIQRGGGLSWQGITEFLQLWDCLMEITLSEQEDHHIWRLNGSGTYSSKSAYKAFFNGSITFEPWCRLWKSWAPPKCKFFLWLAIRNRCWTADKLAKRRLNHPK